MDVIFKKDINNNIVPKLKSELKKSDIYKFINFLNNNNSSEYINYLIEIMQKSPEIGQILIDFNDIYKINGIIECLIEKYIYEKDDNNLLKKFFIFISKSFQINKNIYDYIYKQIGKLIQKSFTFNNENNINKKNIIERCINLLIIFYEKKDDNLLLMNNCFYLYKNSIKSNFNRIELDNINIGICFYIDEFYENNKSIISKIKFDNKEILLIRLFQKNNLDIFLNNEKINKYDIYLKENYWNFLQIKIMNNSINIIINNELTIKFNNKININKKESLSSNIINFENEKSIKSNYKLNKINKFSFYKNFNGIVSPIIISDNEIDLEEYISSKFSIDTKNLILNKKGKNKDKVINANENKESNFNNNYNIPFIICIINGKKRIINPIFNYCSENRKYDLKKKYYTIRKEMKRSNSSYLIIKKKGNDKFFENIKFNRYYNEIKKIQKFFYSNDDFKIKYINLTRLNFIKKIFPYFYCFQNKCFKDNIFLLGGIKNILPLFEIMMEFDKKENTSIILKIIKIVESILLSENNIEDAINSNFFEIFSLFIENLILNNKGISNKIAFLIKKLFKNKYHQNEIFFGFKILLLNKNILCDINENESLFQFVIELENKEEIYDFFISFMKKNKDIEEEFLNKIFEFFYQYLNSEIVKKIKNSYHLNDINMNEKFGEIGKICLLLSEEEINDYIIIKSLNLLIHIFNFPIEKEIINKKEIDQQNFIIKKLLNNSYQNNSILFNQILRNDDIKKNNFDELILKKLMILSYLIENQLMYFFVKLSKNNNINIKLKLLHLHQIIFFYYMNIYGLFSNYKENKFIVQYKNEKKRMEKEEYNSININNQFFEDLSNFSEIKKDNNNNFFNNNIFNTFIISDFISLLKLSLNFYQKEEYYLNFYFPQIINFIKNFISLAISQHLFHLETLNFKTMNCLQNIIDDTIKQNFLYFDLYNSKSFISLILTIMHHIYIIDKEIKNNDLEEINENISEIIFQIYLNAIELNSLNFLIVLKEFSNYIFNFYKNCEYEEKEKKIKKTDEINGFIHFFFKNLSTKRKVFQTKINLDKNRNFLKQFKLDLLKKYKFNIKTIFKLTKNAFNNIKDFQSYISSFQYYNLEYLMLENFLIYFENLLSATSNLEILLEDLTLFLIFCVLLSTNINDISFSKSLNYDFFIELILLSIQLIFFSISINNNILFFVDLFILLISLISFYFKKNKKCYFIEYLKIQGIDSEFKNFINYFVYKNKENKNDLYFLENEIKKKGDSLNFLQKPDSIIIDLKLFYHIIIENTFLEKPKSELYSLTINDNLIYNKLMIKKHYRKIRKELFSWNNSYSDLNLFYNKKDLLKYKILNHYSEEMTLPLLIPILNLNSFLPKGFSKFFTEKYGVIDIISKSSLDDDFLKIKEIIEKLEKSQINENVEKKEILNNTKKSNINNDMKEINNEKIIQNKNKFILEEKILEYFGIINKDIYSCCLLKPGLHITGYFIINKNNSFDFFGFPRELVDKNNYHISSKKKKFCYGSLRKYDKFYYFQIKNKDITFIYKRKYAFIDDGLEIFTKQKKSYYFIFNNIGNNIKSIEEEDQESLNITKNIRDYIYYCLCEENNIQNNNNINILSKPLEYKKQEKNDDIFKNVIFHNNNQKTKNEKENTLSKILVYKYKGKDFKYKNLNSILNSYYNNSISKLEMLMRINLIANRSYNDINQYPIFPWIINNYNTTYTFEKETLTENEILNNLRPLNKPMGMLTQKRFKSCELLYNSTKEDFIEKYGESIPLDFSDFSKLNSLNIEIDYIPIYYGSHYSTPSSVCYYLVRLFPYSISAQLLQGDFFEAPDRLFINLEKSHYNAKNKDNDLRESIPELYYQPELFRNINHLNLGKLQQMKNEDSTYQLMKKLNNLKDNEINVEDVLLPNYSDNNPEKYISLIREIFERPEIKINEWIDLIFGYAQKGEEALKRKNIFSPYCYEGFVNLEKLTLDERNIYLDYFELGINPIQILNYKMNEKDKIIVKNENLYNNGMNIIGMDNEKELDNKKYNNCGSITNRMKYNLINFNKESNFEMIIYKKNLYNCGVLAFEINLNLNQFEQNKTKNYDEEFRNLINLQISSYEINNEFNNEQFKKIQEYLIECIIKLIYKTFIINKQTNRTVQMDEILEKYNKEKNEIKNFLKNFNSNNYKVKINNNIGIIYDFNSGEVFIVFFNKYEPPIELRRKIKTKSGILTYKLDNSEITYFSIDKFILFGTNLGSIIIYEPEEEYIENIIHFHTKSIVCIEQNNILNLMISSSEDGYINIYTLPNASLINSIFLPYFICDSIFISYSPLPSFIVYNKEKELFKSFSINGRNLLKIDKKISNITEMKIKKNEYFIEYLEIYNEKITKCYDLPFLDEIKTNLNDNLNSKIITNQYELKERIKESKKFYKMKIGTKKKNKINKTTNK